MPPVRILHASDLHIAVKAKLTSVFDQISAGMYFHALRPRALASTYDPAILLRLADLIYHDYNGRYINQAAHRLDAVLLTGDLATTGKHHDLEAAVKFIDGPVHPYLPTQTPDYVPTLASSRTPVWLLPGNHDRLRSAKLTGYSPGGKIFDTLFASHWSSPITEYDPILNLSGLSVAVIGADFNLEHKRQREGRWWNKYAQGRVHQSVLDELELATQRIQAKHAASSQDELAIIWAIHFPPKSPAVATSMKLIDDEHLVEAGNRCGISAILAGHTHEPVRYQTPGMKFEVFCAGTATQDFAPRGHYFHILSLSLDAGRNLEIDWENYRFDATNSRFMLV
jgi:3',5'-cyclic AMP phosphodiesterase CpdA